MSQIREVWHHFVKMANKGFLKFQLVQTAVSTIETSSRWQLTNLAKFFVDFDCSFIKIIKGFRNFWSNKGMFRNPLLAIFEILSQIRENSLIWSSLIRSTNCTCVVSWFQIIGVPLTDFTTLNVTVTILTSHNSWHCTFLPDWQVVIFLTLKVQKFDWSGIRTHAPEETRALIWRLRPLGHPVLKSRLKD